MKGATTDHISRSLIRFTPWVHSRVAVAWLSEKGLADGETRTIRNQLGFFFTQMSKFVTNAMWYALVVAIGCMAGRLHEFVDPRHGSRTHTKSLARFSSFQLAVGCHSPIG